MRVGILGGGQLARMLALAGRPLGLDFEFLCPAPDACAAPLGHHRHAGFHDEEALRALAASVDVVTYEFENVPAETVAVLEGRVPVYPPPPALAHAQDRLREKTLFRELDIPTPAFAPIDDLAQLRAAIEDVGLPAVLKTRTEGYDGKGQFVLREAGQAEAAWTAIGEVPAILEAFVDYSRELSILAVRGRDGEIRHYPLSENTHEQGILRLSVARPGEALQSRAEELVRGLLERLDYVGVIALELFQVGDALLANEFAPRVHNSGHWTIEGAEISQFENHLRAVLGWPLGSTDPVGFAAMVNFIGHLPPAEAVLALPHTHFHDYGKAPREGRKVGHATVRCPDAAARDRAVKILRERIP